MDQFQPKRAVRGEIIGKCRACEPGHVHAHGVRYACDNCDFIIFAHCKSHLGLSLITPEEMTALLADDFPWLFGFINQWSEAYGGYGYLVHINGKWIIRCNWQEPRRPEQQEQHQPVRARRAASTATADTNNTDNNGQKED